MRLFDGCLNMHGYLTIPKSTMYFVSTNTIVSLYPISAISPHNLWDHQNTFLLPEELPHIG